MQFILLLCCLVFFDLFDLSTRNRHGYNEISSTRTITSLWFWTPVVTSVPAVWASEQLNVYALCVGRRWWHPGFTVLKFVCQRQKYRLDMIHFAVIFHRRLEERHLVDVGESLCNVSVDYNFFLQITLVSNHYFRNLASKIMHFCIRQSI